MSNTDTKRKKGEEDKYIFFIYFYILLLLFFFKHVQLRVNYCWGSDVWDEAESKGLVISVFYRDSGVR